MTYELTLNGDRITQGEGESGSWPFELSKTGIHELCFYAVDETQNRTNRNFFYECRTMELSSRIYDTLILANWNGGIVSSQEVTAKIQLGPDQLIRWTEGNTSEFNLVIPSSVIEEVTFDLKEGENKFAVEVDSLNETDTYYLTVVRDTIPPVVSIEERVNRTTTLAQKRVLEGVCEGGTSLLVWSEIDSVSLTCPYSGTYSVQIEILQPPGEYDIQVISNDHANNEARASTKVLMQDWPDWAVDDAKNMGPMLGWFSLAGLLVTAIVLVTLRSMFPKKEHPQHPVGEQVTDSYLDNMLRNP